eukprot:CFRG1650T1
MTDVSSKVGAATPLANNSDAIGLLSDDDGFMEAMGLDLEHLDITTDDVSFDEVGVHIMENLEDDLIKQALESGVDLRDYAREVEAKLVVVEKASINDYLQEAGNIAELHKQLRSCDEMLCGMEQMLTVFQDDLGTISIDIQKLQSQSIVMNEKLKNRRAVETRLGGVVNEAVLPPAMISYICDGEINAKYVSFMNTLNRKLSFTKREKTRKEIGCVDDIMPEMQKLAIKAIDRTREFLYVRILKMREELPKKTNIQLHQDNQLMPFKYFIEFYKQHNRSVAQEICAVYVDTMQKVFYSLFKHYLKKLTALGIDEVADKDDLVGTPEGSKRLFLSSRLAQKQNVFTLGDRAQILDSLEDTVIIPHVSSKQNDRFYIEKLFRSYNYAMLDNACHEYLFIVQFFQVKTGGGTMDIFKAVFERSLNLFTDHLRDLLNSCFDTIGVLLCIRIVHFYQRMAQHRCIPALERYHQSLEMLLWPRLKMLLDMNIRSVKECSDDPKKLGSIETRPHYVTRRFAEFAASVIVINQDWNDPQLEASMSRLLSELEAFLANTAALFGRQKDRLVFYINNYDLILTVMQEQTIQPSNESKYFDTVLNAKIQSYVQEELSPYFGDLMLFVSETEPLLTEGKVQLEQGRVEKLVRSFAQDWRRAIDAINADVLQSFTNFKAGTDILQAVLTGLILHYQRFLAIMGKPPFNTLSCRHELINIHHVMVEVKKHRATF